MTDRPSDLFSLAGRVAVVTGGNGGIGLGMATGLAKAGAQVIVAGRDAAKSAAAVEALRAAGGHADALPVDVTDAASVEALMAQTKARFGRLDILVNNAGTNIRKEVLQRDVPNLYSRRLRNERKFVLLYSLHEPVDR